MKPRGRPKSERAARVERALRVAHESGLLQRWGAKAELARLYGVHPKHLATIARRIGL